MTLAITEIMTIAPVIPVLTVDDADKALPLAEALVAGGIKVLEVTLRTPAALDAIRRMASVPGAIVGAGTVLNADDAARAADAGACFLISPGLTETLARAATSSGLPFLPGVATASDVMRGLDLGLTHFKFFPAESSGGAAAVKALGGPFAACRFCPTGGIGLQTAPDYLALPNVLCVGGTWIAPPAVVEANDWDRVTQLACDAAGLRDRR